MHDRTLSGRGAGRHFRPASVLAFAASAFALTSVAGERAARAAGDPPEIEIGVRAGYAVPAGGLTGSSGATEGLKLGNSIAGLIPLSADLGIRPVPHLYIGGYFSYGFGIRPKDTCPAGADCSAHDLRFGLDVAYHALPRGKADPWIGVGAGYEILGASESTSAASVSDSFGGFEFAHVQAGVDFKGAGIGPFVMASIGEYATASADGTSSSDFPTTTHSWIELGLRGFYDIALGPKYDVDPEDDVDDRPTRRRAPSRPVDSAPAPPAPAAVPPPPPVASAFDAAPGAAPAAPAAPIVFPPGVRMADRSQCTFICSAGGQQLPPSDAARVEGPMKRHLSALRGCSVEAGRVRESPPMTVQFDASGTGHALLHLARGTESMRACVSRFPASPTLSGPPGATWSCEDVCN